MTYYQLDDQDATAATVSMLKAHSAEPPEKQATAVIDALRSSSSIRRPTYRTSDLLWKVVVGGLVLVLIIAVVGVSWATLDGNSGTSPDALLATFTTVLAGVVGLFAKSPGQDDH